MQLIIGLVVAIILFTLLRQWGSAEPHQRKAWLRNLLIGGLMLVLVLLVVTGRLHVLGAVLAGLLAFIGKLPRLLEWWPWIKRALARLDTGNAADDVSVVETDLLRMVLHRQTGYMEGSVRCGRWQGQALEQLDDESLLALHAEAWRRHLDSLPLLEAYLDRRLGAGWRERTGA
ncbi:MAG: molecular chaperone DnaJ, partial [Gammaproteobacteria bacterium]|nr:molecular chaperone DnaJ [Gammaproteobacteria bacterium]